MSLREKILEYYLDDGEFIHYIAHKKIVVAIVSFIKIGFLGILLPIGLYLILPQALFVSAIWLLIGLVKLSYAIFNWYFDAWIITNMGVIDIEWDGVFNRTSIRIDYQNIEGVVVEVNGFLQTVLNYGNIHISRIGSGNPVTLEEARNPREIEQKVLYFQDMYNFKRNLNEHSALKDLLTSMLHTHVQKKGAPNVDLK